jgi:hypothetical protein
MATFWMGSTPTRCDLCNTKLKHLFVDGKTVMGSWGILCAKCFEDCGVGLGTGKGQLYIRLEKQDSDGRQRWQRVAG